MRLETFGQTFQDFEPKLDKAAYLEFASTPAARPLLSSSCFPENPTQTWELESRAAAVHTTSLGSGSCFLPPKIASPRHHRRGKGQDAAQHKPLYRTSTTTAAAVVHRPAGRTLPCLPTCGSACSCSFHQQRAGTGTQGSATRSRHTGPRFLEPDADASVFLTFWHRVLHKPWGIGGDSNSPSGRGWGVSSLSHRSQIVLIV